MERAVRGQVRLTGAGFRRAPVHILVLGDPRVNESYPVRTMLEKSARHFYSGLANATMSLMLAATSLGLAVQYVSDAGSPYMGTLLKVRYGIPDPLEVYELVPVGWPGLEVKPTPRRPLDSMIHRGRFEPAKFLSDQQMHDFLWQDTLIFADERFKFQRPDGPDRLSTELGAGHRESQLFTKAGLGDATARLILGTLQRVIVHQFHNTAPTARIRTKWVMEDGRYLKEDAGNLAPFLYRLQNQAPQQYERIVETIRSILPFFAAFELEPEFGRLLLRWREIGSDYVFSASQAADGMLRVMALVALLEQPEGDLPDVLVLDEPELGLHPYAIEVLAGLLRSVAHHVQVIVATQSTSLLDRFDPESVVVVDRRGPESSFHRLDADALADWLDDYTLSELWEKNVIGGRPSSDQVTPRR